MICPTCNEVVGIGCYSPEACRDFVRSKKSEQLTKLLKGVEASIKDHKDVLEDLTTLQQILQQAIDSIPLGEQL